MSRMCGRSTRMTLDRDYAKYSASCSRIVVWPCWWSARCAIGPSQGGVPYQKSQGAFDDYGYSARLGRSESPNFLSSQRPGQLAAPWNRVDHGLDDGGEPADVDLGGIEGTSRRTTTDGAVALA